MIKSSELDYHYDSPSNKEKNRYSSIEPDDRNSSTPDHYRHSKQPPYNESRRSTYKSSKNNDYDDSNTRIYVENIPDSITKYDLYDLFDPYGRITDAYISPKSPHFALITYTTSAECIKAIQKTNDTKMSGTYIKVSHALPRKSGSKYYCTNCRNYGHTYIYCKEPANYVHSNRSRDRYPRSMSRTPPYRSRSRLSRSRSRSFSNEKPNAPRKSYSNERIYVKSKIKPPQTPPSARDESSNRDRSLSRTPLSNNDSTKPYSSPPATFKTRSNRSKTEAYNGDATRSIEINEVVPQKQKIMPPVDRCDSLSHSKKDASKRKLTIEAYVQVKPPLMINQIVQTDPVIILDKKYSKKSAQPDEYSNKKSKYDRTSSENLKNYMQESRKESKQRYY